MFGDALQKIQGGFSIMKKEKNEIKHTAHSTYRCQYHIVFAPKYRRKILYDNNIAEKGKILRDLCEWKSLHIIGTEVCWLSHTFGEKAHSFHLFK